MNFPNHEFMVHLSSPLTNAVRLDILAQLKRHPWFFREYHSDGLDWLEFRSPSNRTLAEMPDISINLLSLRLYISREKGEIWGDLDLVRDLLSGNIKRIDYGPVELPTMSVV